MSSNSSGYMLDFTVNIPSNDENANCLFHRKFTMKVILADLLKYICVLVYTACTHINLTPAWKSLHFNTAL